MTLDVGSVYMECSIRLGHWLYIIINYLVHIIFPNGDLGINRLNPWLTHAISTQSAGTRIENQNGVAWSLAHPDG